jgi:peptidoglycan/LPS O-acetylase OafA/YrhL
MVCFTVRGRRPMLGPLLVCAGLLAVKVAWMAAGSGGTGTTGHVVADLPAAAGFAAVTAMVAARPPGLLTTAPMRALGALSYGVYLWHLPVL